MRTPAAESDRPSCGEATRPAARHNALQDEPPMRSRVHAIVFLPVLLLFLMLSTPVHAQENGVKHPLTFAELTYGDAIQAIVADGTGGFWFGGSTCSTTLPTTSNAIQKSWSGQLCDGGLLGR